MGTISQFVEVNEELLNSYLMWSIKWETVSDTYVKRAKNDLER